MKLSARNQLKGVVKSIKELGLKPGKEAYAVIKATSVMVGVDE